MPGAYVVVAYRRIDDPEALARYAALSGPALRAHGARFLARGNPEHVLEAGLRQRLVVVEFDDVAQAHRAFTSPEYQRAAAELGTTVERDIRIIPGAA